MFLECSDSDMYLIYKTSSNENRIERSWLSNIRCQFLNIFSTSCYNQLHGINFMPLWLSAKLHFLVGDIDYAFNSDICSFFTTTGNKLFQNVLIPEMLYYAVKCMSVI